MSKYIIEIAKEYEEYFKGVLICGIADGKFAVDVIAREDLEELNSDYINENFGDLQDTAYQRGLKDAWEAARKVIHLPEGVVLDLFTDCYSSVCTVLQVFLKYEGSEVIEKLKAYEEKQKADDEIKVGDEVKRKNTPESERGGIVTKDWENSYYIMWTDGSSGQWDKDRVVKTGRHFDIDKILEEMRHD